MTPAILANFINLAIGKSIKTKNHFNKKGDIGMSSADPPDQFDWFAGAAQINQPCGENFLSLACDHDGDKYTSWSPDIKLILDTSNLC